MSTVYAVETARVYRAGGRRFFSRAAAIRRYAKEKFFAKHPCVCEQPEHDSGYPGFDCGEHDRWEKVKPRYVRVIRKALRRKVTSAGA